ncbi:MAG: hypothetical protein ACRC77_08560 [Bacteroidales bacterium]
MKKILFILGAVSMLTLASCNSNSAKQTQATETTETTKSATIPVAQVLENPDHYIGGEIAVEGICTHRCKHGGAKMFIMGNNDKQILRVESSEASGKFPTEVVNNMVVVKGTLVEDKIDEAYLQKWESELKQEMEKHGEAGGCATEKAARNESAEANTPEKRIADFRQKIKERKDKEGKDYLSFYHLEAQHYDIMN